MDFFSDKTPTTEQGQETDNNQEAHEPQDFLQAVVSEKGEQWSDPQALAKGYWHSQRRIKELEEAAAQADKNDYAKQLLEQVRGQAPAGDSGKEEPEIQKQATQDDDKTSLSPEEIQRLMDETLSEREKANKINTNLQSVQAQLQETYGTEAQSVMQQKANEVGLSIDWMKELAGESPDAFLRLIGEPPKKQGNNIPNNSVNTSAVTSQGNNDRDASYYRDLRRSNRKLYYNPQTQIQMQKDAERLGERFYK